MKMAALFLTTFLTPLVGWAADCHLQSESEAIRSCLNGYGKEVLALNAPQGVQDRYLNELQGVLQKSGIESFDLSQTKSLNQAFRIEIPSTKDLLNTEDPQCFAFNNGGLKSLTRGNTEYVVKAVQGQMKEAAYFLKTYHAWSLGQASSHLFQIRSVELCADTNKSISFDKGTLKINMAFGVTGSKGYKASEIFSEWNNGNIVFGEALGFVGQKVAGLKGDTSAVIKSNIRPAWLVLNPIGDIRFQLRMALHKHTGETLRSLLRGDRSAAAELAEKSEELGLTRISLNEEQARNVLNSFSSKLLDSEFVNQVLDQVLVSTNGGSHSVQVIDNRVNIGLVAVKNNKQISINVSALFPSPLEMTEELKAAQEASANQVSAQLNGKNIGLVAVDLFDQVAVNVVPPNLQQIIQRVGLKEALKDKAHSTKTALPLISL